VSCLYEIPKNLNRYSEEFVPVLKWNLRQSVYGAVAFFLCFGLFLKLPEAKPMLKLSLPLISFVFLGILIHLKVDEKLLSWMNLMLSLRNVGYSDSRMDKFVPIKQIKNDIVYTSDEKCLAILKTKPIDFSLLSEDEQLEVISSYQYFLRSLDFPCQISCRSVEVNLNKWYTNVIESADKTGNKERMKHMIEWMKKNIEDNKTRTRIFYIVIPYERNKKDKEAAEITILNERSKDIIKRLDNCDLKTFRMGTDELLSLYSSYFTDLSEMNMTLLSPVTWLKKVDA